jgi:hypothetical protein
MDYNKPETWTEKIHEMPLGVDVKAYQEKINGICGLSPFGTPNVKLTWMPSIENYSKYYSEWNEAGFGTKAILRCQYVYETVYEKGIPFDIPPPRWALKQFVHPSRYITAEETVRWKIMQDGQQVLLRENRPPRSDKGFYTNLRRIGKHNPWCCRKMKKQGLTCWGEYRKPDSSYLLMLKKAVAIREKEENQSPNEPLTEETMAKAALEAANEIKEQDEQAEAYLLARIEENLPKIAAAITGDDSFLDRRKDYSFSNGLFIPKNYAN